MALITCGTHGKQEETFVCRHIIDSLKDGEARGFYWNYVDGAFEAVCAACNEMTADEAASASLNLIQPLCYGCFRDAAALNGVDID